jgi:hypothetical protein
MTDTRLCDHPEHLQYGMGHLPGPPLEQEYAAPAVSFPPTYWRPFEVPVLNQGSTPECEGYTAVTGRRITQPPLGQDGFNPDDIFHLAGGGSGGTTTAAIERVLLSPGALCSSGPDNSHRKPVASCQNIGTLSALKGALMTEFFVGLARTWYESDFKPKHNGLLSPSTGGVAGGHIFAVCGFSDDGTKPVGAPAVVQAPGVPALGCQNSWATGWSTGGFFWLPYASLDRVLEAYTQIAVPLPSAYTPRTSSMSATTYITPIRILDTRLSGGSLAPGEDRKVQVAGAHGIPSNAIGVSGDLAVTAPQAVGWLALTPIKWVGPSSNINFVAGQTIANGFTCGLDTDSTFSIHNGSVGTVHAVIDIAAFDLP